MKSFSEEFYDRENTSIDLIWIGNKSAAAADGDDVTKCICEFCNVRIMKNEILHDLPSGLYLNSQSNKICTC